MDRKAVFEWSHGREIVPERWKGCLDGEQRRISEMF